MQTRKVLAAAALAAASLVGTSANAAFINGGISFNGFFDTLPNLPNTLVSALTSFDVAPIALAGGASGDFANGVATSLDFSILAAPTTLFTSGGYTFTVDSWGPASATAFTCPTDQCGDAITFAALGTVTGNGFNPTGFTMTWSAQGTCNESTATPGICGTSPTASWSASISATGSDPVQVPEPAMLALVGLGLAGIGLSRRARKAA